MSESVCVCVCVCACVRVCVVCVCVCVFVFFNLMQHPDVNSGDLSGQTRSLWLRDAVVF